MCEKKLTGPTQSQSALQNPSVNSADDEVRSVIVERFDAIKNKDEKSVTALMNEGYRKFDGCPLFQRQEAAVALQNEFFAFKVLSNCITS